MRNLLISALALPVLVSAHGIDPALHKRQASASSASISASSVAATGSSGSVAATGSSGSLASGSATTTPAASTTLSVYSFSLPSTNPTAIPISLISSGALSASTLGVTTTYAAGTVPTFLPNAPALPDASKLVPSNYPTLDKQPPTDSAEVLQWIEEVKNSGITIPDIEPNVAGGCSANTAAAANSSNCWWTCGGCTRDDDVVSCPTKNNWGMTYDDGPAPYSPNLLAYLDQQNLKATLFQVGSRVISYPQLAQEEYMAQHQIGVHTWSHPAMTTMSTEIVIAELGWSKKIIKDTLGVTPLYWRPPYGDVDDRVRAIAKAMNLTTVIWTRYNATMTFDTGDFTVPGGQTTASEVALNWENILNASKSINTGFIVLEHDLFAQTVELATGYVIPAGIAAGLNITPVITCMGLELKDAYVETNDNTTNPLPGVASSSGSGSGSGSGTGAAEATGAASGTSGAGRVGAMSGYFVAAGTAMVGLAAGLTAVL